jgi:hypothetical protein
VRGFAQEHRGVGDAGERGLCGGRLLGHLPQCVRQRDERTREIAAVHRRHVLRLERMTIVRIVPVEEMALMMLEFRHAAKGRLDAIRHVERPNPAEIAGRHCRQQVQSDVGR